MPSSLRLWRTAARLRDLTACRAQALGLSSRDERLPSTRRTGFDQTLSDGSNPNFHTIALNEALPLETTEAGGQGGAGQANGIRESFQRLATGTCQDLEDLAVGFIERRHDIALALVIAREAFNPTAKSFD